MTDRKELAYKYLIVGGGMTAAAAIAGIREIDRVGTIGLLSTESHPPYQRPPLTKSLWKGAALDSIWLSVESDGVRFHLGRTAESIDADNKCVVDTDGTRYIYDKLLIATGCRPRRFAFNDDDIICFRTVEDWQRLHAHVGRGRRIAIIGAGFIASELAASLASIGQQVVMIFPGEAIGARVYPAELSAFLNDLYREKGVELRPGSHLSGCELRDGTCVLTLRDDSGVEREERVDDVVAGIGVEPNVELARGAGLRVDDGICVDASLRTSDPHIFAAGDVASFHDHSLNEWRRVEHADNATTMGGYVGVSMAGRTVTYDHTPFFYSDFFDFGYEAIGRIDSRLEMVAEWQEPFRKGVIYYLRDGSVRGMLFWNIWGQVDAARRILGTSRGRLDGR